MGTDPDQGQRCPNVQNAPLDRLFEGKIRLLVWAPAPRQNHLICVTGLFVLKFGFHRFPILCFEDYIASLRFNIGFKVCFDDVN